MSQAMIGVEPRVPAVIEVINPATGEKIARVRVQDRAQVAAAVELARRPQREWAACSFRERARALSRYRDRFFVVQRRQHSFSRIHRFPFPVAAVCGSASNSISSVFIS